MKGKKIIIDILIVLACIGLIIGIFAFYNFKNKSSEFEEDAIAGTIIFKVYYKNDELVIDEKLEFSEGETIYHILERNHKLVSMDSVGVGKGILEIDEYTTNFTDDYFMLYLNGSYSTLGTELIQAEDNMEIKLVWVKIN